MGEGELRSEGVDGQLASGKTSGSGSRLGFRVDFFLRASVPRRLLVLGGVEMGVDTFDDVPETIDGE